MTLTLADIERWDAGSVREVFHAATSRAQAAADAANGLATLPAFQSWGGTAAEAATEAIGKTRRDLDAHGREAQAVANAARAAADEIEHLKSELAMVRADAEALGMEIDPVAGRVLPGRSVRDPMEALLKEEQLQPRVDAIMGEANAVDSALANAIHMADGSRPIPATPHDNRPEIQAALNKPLPEDPKAFGDLWNQLTPEEKDWLYGKDHELGNHPGMPFAPADGLGRDHYGRMRLDELQGAAQAGLDAMQARFDELSRQAYMGDHSGQTANELNRLGPQLMAARHELDGYKAVRGTLDTKDGVARYLGFIDDKGHAAVSIGNPDTAERVATFVPGTGQDMAAFEGSNEKSYRMYSAALAADKSLMPGDVSVTTWMGYDRPMNLFEAGFTQYATGGASSLDSFQDGLRASHFGDPALTTVIGHSYGSTLVGAAASGGHHLDANNVIAVGSPGMLVSRATDLNLDPGAGVYAMRASNDVITFATDTVLGPDPVAQAFGSTGLMADAGPSVYGVLPTVAAHSSYWNPGNVALSNLGAVIAGTPPPVIGYPNG